MFLFAYCHPALPPCLWAGRIRGLTLSPVSLCSLPASSCTHLDRPHGLSFRLSSPPDADGHIFFTLRQALCALSRFDPPSRHGTPLPYPAPPVAVRRDKRTSGCPVASYANRKWGPSSALFTRPAPAGRTHAHSGALPLRVEPRQAAPHKTKRKESRGFPSSCQRGGHRASQILS